MAPVLLKKFNLSMSCEQFLSQFWYDDNHHFYESFLRDKLQDVGISIVAWSSSSSEMKAMSRQRTVRSFHPSKISFPGLPSHAEVSISMKMITKSPLT